MSRNKDKAIEFISQLVDFYEELIVKKNKEITALKERLLECQADRDSVDMRATLILEDFSR